jgi:hypothetical protein
MLTDYETRKRGSVWLSERKCIAEDFAISFTVCLTRHPGDPRPAAADGLAFVMHNDPRGIEAVQALGKRAGGGGLGYAGLHDALAVEFDIHINREYGDPQEPHTAVASTISCNKKDRSGVLDFLATRYEQPRLCSSHDASHGHQLGPIFPLGDIVDGPQVHTFHVRYSAAQQRLYVVNDSAAGLNEESPLDEKWVACDLEKVLRISPLLLVGLLPQEVGVHATSLSNSATQGCPYLPRP